MNFYSLVAALCQVIGTSSNVRLVQQQQINCQAYFVKCVEMDKFGSYRNDKMVECVTKRKAE